MDWDDEINHVVDVTPIGAIYRSIRFNRGCGNADCIVCRGGISVAVPRVAGFEQGCSRCG